MTVSPEHGGARRPHRALVNPAHPGDRYRQLDRNSNLDPYLAAISDEAPVNRSRDPHCMKGS
ncbi:MULTISPECIES: hypothetical protein [unclassified Micromonospora]|uniref:hypothetical protein n=1 Tax=unclassified Micromonospora TaxID=2617518 RepID=UPI001C21357C|nr:MULTISPECIES: hypothetical protein [unclassified Micromonospora]MBU8858636.1 hypothetical protein [Micromonospora sp. WMMB482]MDM4784280.1 hypothetical protein [Micromonospora sp. b486]